MIREVLYRVTATTIDPATKQWIGMQGEDNATVVKFDFSAIPDCEKYSWRIDFDNTVAGNSKGLYNGEIGTISRAIPYNMTRFGGDVQITLVGEDKANEVIVYSIPVKGYLKGVSTSEPSEDKGAIYITDAEISARKSAEEAKNSAEIAAESAESARRSEALTEQARRVIEEDTVVVFVGGDASTETEVDLVVDDELSEFSSNPISNKEVFKEFKSIDADLKAYINQQIAAAQAAVYKQAMEDVHPIGSIYISSKPTNPSTIFGGEWEQIQDAFIFAKGDNSYKLEESGGNARVTIKEANLPAHAHSAANAEGNAIPGAEYHFSLNRELGSDETGRVSVAKGSDYYVIAGIKDEGAVVADLSANKWTAKTGGGQELEIMPPYVMKYAWERVS